MSSIFPSILTTYTNPNPTDKLNAPSHSGIETNQNSGLQQVEAVIGTISSVSGTLMYDIRAAASNGGGHVQTANKGGTSQTSYTKGDLLVASSASVLSKLSVGTDGQALLADNSQSAGVKWGSPTATAVIASAKATSSVLTLSVTSIPTNDFYEVDIYVSGMSGNDSPIIQFNLDTGNNYRRIKEGGSGTAAQGYIDPNGGNLGGSTYTMLLRFTINNWSSGDTKSVIGQALITDGSGGSLAEFGWGGNWNNVAALLSSIQLKTASGSTLKAGTRIVITGGSAT